MMREWVTVLCILICGATLGVVLWNLRSFGAYTERIERSNAIVRQSNELTRQSNWRTVEEITANREAVTLAHERNLAVFADAQNLRHELKGLIDQQRSA